MIVELREFFGVTTFVLLAGHLIGFLFGWVAERSDFCIRSALTSFDFGNKKLKNNANNHLIVLIIASLVAFASVSIGQKLELLDYNGSIYTNPSPNVFGIFLGSLIFGVGMWFCRGCISRVTVLSGRGNVRALIALFFAAFASLASLTGFLSGPRNLLASIKAPEILATGIIAIGEFWFLVAGFFLIFVLKNAATAFPIKDMVYGLVLGLCVPLCFFATSILGADEFEPIHTQGLVFTSSIADTLSFASYSTALTPKFGMGLVIGAVFGAFVSSTIRGTAKIEGFQNAPHPIYYIAGGILMGFGGVLSGGCTVGWLLTGASVNNGGVIVAFLGFLFGVSALSSFSRLTRLSNLTAQE